MGNNDSVDGDFTVDGLDDIMGDTEFSPDYERKKTALEQYKGTDENSALMRAVNNTSLDFEKHGEELQKDLDKIFKSNKDYSGKSKWKRWFIDLRRKYISGKDIKKKADRFIASMENRVQTFEEALKEVAEPIQQHPFGMGSFEFDVVPQHRSERHRIHQAVVVPAR